jgi:hypothetical protein
MPSKSVLKTPYYNMRQIIIQVYLYVYRERKRIMVVTGYEQDLKYFEEINPKKQFDKV